VVLAVSTSDAATLTFLFTDIEGSSSLWERYAARMEQALARHDALARGSVAAHGGTLVKMTGDGMHAAFADPLAAVLTALDLQQGLADAAATAGVALRLRCGMHAGVVEHRDGDYFGSAVNRAARLMSVAHGGQVLASRVVIDLVRERLPRGVSLRDLGAVRLRDLSSPEAVFQVTCGELRREFPPLRSLEAIPNNLPQQVTSFVGREHDLAAVEHLLLSARLVTLIGAGGIGKSRLALQAAAATMDRYPDGVWLVELAPLTDARLLPQAVAQVLGAKEDAGRPVREALTRFVGERKLLLVLDNCEHLVAACAGLVEHLLRCGPQIGILATSRERLRVPAEANYPLPALSFPASDAGLAAPAALVRYEAVRLFVERANAVHPSFRLNEQNASAVIEICRHLDGIPLALELAAARVRALAVASIAARLGDRFRLLASGNRTALPRQQTLRALIDWSHDLLAEPERALFRRLAVFAGGWTLDAAEAVGAGGEIDSADVLELLTALVEKSLVAVDADGARYRLLETMRQYAEERLGASDEAVATRTRHLQVYLALVEQARPEFDGPRQGEWLARLDAERENILAAHAWCDRAEDGGAFGMRLVYAAQPWWISHGALELGHRVIGEALARPGAQARDLLRCKALFAAGWLAYYMARYGEAKAWLEESLSIARETGDGVMVAMTLQPLGMASLGQGDAAAARRHLEEALALARRRGDRRQLVAALNSLAQLDRLEGDLDRAEPLYEDVLALARAIGDRESIALALLNLAMASIDRARPDRARMMLLEASAIAEEIGSKPAGQSVLEVSAGLGAVRGDWSHVALFFGAAEAQAAHSGLHRDPADEGFLAPLIAKARAALGAEAFSVAESAGGALAYEQAVGAARAWLFDGP
jgi:predicted ATPase/class 3 adenylate cyclase